MHFSAIFLTLGALASAAPSCPMTGASEPPEGEFMPARPGDVRGPCPMLNVLANHGYFPRNGRELSQEVVRKAMKAGLNVDSDFADLMFAPGLRTSPRINSSTFNLDDLNRHGLLEHDGSLSRTDAYWDASQEFNTTVYAESLSYLGKSDTITLQSAAAARMARMATSRATNPTFMLNETAASISFGESGAYILALGDRVTGTVPLDRVRMMFEQEKLPRELGWNASIPANANDLFNMTRRVIEAAQAQSGSKLRIRGTVGFHGGVVNAAMAERMRK